MFIGYGFEESSKDFGRVTDEDVMDEVRKMEKSKISNNEGWNVNPNRRAENELFKPFNQLSDEERQLVYQQAFERKTKKRVTAIKLMQEGYSLEKQDRWDEAILYYHRAKFVDKKMYMYCLILQS